MSESDTDRSGRGAAAALEHVVDPVVAVHDETVVFANDAARRVFGLPDDVVGTSPGDAFDEHWERLASEIQETMLGTVRHVPLDIDEYDARVHRGETGVTIVLQRFEPTEPVDVDRAVKTRAIDEAPIGFSLSDPDLEDNPLVYVNPAYEELTGYDAADIVGRNCRFLQGPDSSETAVKSMRTAIENEQPVTVEVRNYRQDGTEFWNEVTIAPVRDEQGTVTNFVGFQNDVTDRKEAQLALEERTAELEYILERVEGLIQDVTAAVTGATTRSDLETAVCGRIATDPAYEGAWVGERDPAKDTVAVRANAGVEPATLSMADDHPAARSLRSEAVAVATLEGRTHAAFPITYNGIEYGTLVVCSPEEREVDDRERLILSALTRAVGSGINARETSRMLATDSVVAVDIEITDPALPPVAISADTGGTLEYRRSVHRTGDDTASLFTVTNASVEALEAAGDALENASLEILVDRDDRTLVELQHHDDIVRWLSDRGVVVQSIDTADGSARLTLEIPQSTNVRSVVEAVEARYSGTDIISFRQQERSGASQEEFAASLEADLTERQFASLQRAYLGGYFEWPRPTTGEELAQSMGVSRPTFHEHLRTAEAKLCRAFFGDD
ncbi:bacterio-opsin activator domain-containing protein [Natronosalvus vescus]|uniref:bacterio-opsin activator domain-containing protein n=1 Tax=Natronosalvus vescus TaxID=2953881 RepID=UPI002091706C|nr:bacterio-opsin activator domain-containing protein [Natronosalvus vescus]